MEVYLPKRACPSMCTHQAQNWSKNWRKWVFRIEISEKCGRLVCLLGAHTFGARLGKCASNMVPNDLLISYLNSKKSKSYESPHFTFKKWRTFLNGVIYEICGFFAINWDQIPTNEITLSASCGCAKPSARSKNVFIKLFGKIRMFLIPWLSL